MDLVISAAVVAALVLQESAVAVVLAVALVQAAAVVEAAQAVSLMQAVLSVTTQAVMVQPLPLVLP